MSQSMSIGQRFQGWLSNNPDESVLRWLFRSVVIVTITVLGLDLAGMNGLLPHPELTGAPSEGTRSSPILDLPTITPSVLTPWLPGSDKRAMPLPQQDGALTKPMTFELVGGGRLMATGTITPGISEAFAAEIGKRRDYIKTVVLNSPGGSVSDALAMGRLIRESKFATEVEAGKYCASSCPLMFAGGIERRAGDKAAIGVHQIIALGSGPAGLPRNDISIAQNISARCQRYLGDMGVNLQVWVHAMETPHDRLFIFKPDELKSLNLVTTAPVVAPAASAPPAPVAAPATAPKSRS